MLNDLNQFESSNLPAVQNANPPAVRTTVSPVDVSSLFEAALRNATPLEVSADVKSSVDTQVLESLDRNLVIIRDRMLQDSPSSTKNVAKEKREVKEETRISKEEKKYRDEMLKIEKRKLKLNEAAEKRRRDALKMRGRSGSGTSSTGMKAVEDMLRNPYAIFDKLLGKAGSGLKDLIRFGRTLSDKESNITTTTRTTRKRSTSSVTSSQVSSQSSSPSNVQHGTGTLEDIPVEGTPPQEASNALALPAPDGYESETDNVSDLFGNTDDAVDVEYTIQDDPMADILNDSPAATNEVGADEEQEEFFKNANKANVIVSDTFEHPEDSEFVETITSQTRTDTESSGGMGIGQTLLGLAIVAALAPHMDRVIGVVESVLDFLRNDVFPIISDLYHKVLEPILVGAKDGIITIINGFADLLSSSLSMLKSLILVAKEVFDALQPVIGDLVVDLVHMVSLVSNLISAIAESMIQLFTDPATWFTTAAVGLGTGISKGLEVLVGNLVSDLVHGFRMILPESLGGFDKKYKKTELQKMEDEYQIRHQENMEMQAAISSSIVNSLTDEGTSLADIQASTVNVYAVNPSAMNTTSVETTTAAAGNVDNSQATVNVFTGGLDVNKRPGGSL